MSETELIDNLEKLANQSPLSTFDARLDASEDVLVIDGDVINLGDRVDYWEYYDGEVRYYTYSVGDYVVDITQMTKYVVEVEDKRED